MYAENCVYTSNAIEMVDVARAYALLSKIKGLSPSSGK